MYPLNKDVNLNLKDEKKRKLKKSHLYWNLTMFKSELVGIIRYQMVALKKKRLLSTQVMDIANLQYIHEPKRESSVGKHY